MWENSIENSISLPSLDKILSAHDGDMALLYLYFVRNGVIDGEDAALTLCRTMAEITAAEEKLRRMGLLSDGDLSPAPAVYQPTPKKPQPVKAAAQALPDIEPALPEYTSDEISRRTKEDGIFSGLLDECAKVVGHTLSGSDMKMLFTVYDYLSLPPEVIMELLNYCGEIYIEKYGSSRRPSVRAIEKEAFRWARLEIFSFEQAEEHIRKQRERRSRIGKIKPLLGIGDRNLSSSEVKYIDSWLDMGFEDEALAIAYDRTVTGTGSLKWPYMDAIIKNWHNANLHTAQEIEVNDAPRRAVQKSDPVAVSGGISNSDMEELRNALKKI